MVNFVTLWPDTGQVDLSALPTILSVLNTLINFLLDLTVN